MNFERILNRSIFILLFLIFSVNLSSAEAVETRSISSGFTYQGQIRISGEPYTGQCDFQFGMYDSETLGSFLGDTSKTDVPVSDGYFTTLLDFGSGMFTGDNRWLEIWVRCPSGEGSYQQLLPRQPLTAVPYAHYAVEAGLASNSLTANYANSVPWTGITSLPEGFADGVDDDTNYSAGSGLTLISNEFSADTSTLQARVSDNCEEGSAIKTIHTDGTIECETIPKLETFSTNTVNTKGDVFWQTSIAIGSDGLPIISYYNSTSHDLEVAHCNDTACSSTTVSSVDTAGIVGRDSSIAIGLDGLGLISYHDSTNHALKVAHCNNVACTSASTSTLDSIGDPGYTTSIAIGSDGLGLISYGDTNGYHLKVAHCSNVTCSSADIYWIWYIHSAEVNPTSLTIGSDGLGLISTRADIGEYLRIAHCNDVACSSADIYDIDTYSWFQDYHSITIGADGLGLISFFDELNDNLRIAHCNNIACSDVTSYTLDETGNVGWYNSIVIGADGLGLISYFDADNSDLKVAHCNNTICSSATTFTLDSLENVGYFTSIAIGADGLGVISYLDESNGDLKVAHCSNNFCMPLTWGD